MRSLGSLRCTTLQPRRTTLHPSDHATHGWKTTAVAVDVDVAGGGGGAAAAVIIA